jgi:hypothetical protein
MAAFHRLTALENSWCSISPPKPSDQEEHNAPNEEQSTKAWHPREEES